VFGTWYDGSNKPSGYGIPDAAYDQQPFRQFLRDGWMLYVKLGAWLLLPVRKAMAHWERVPARTENPSARLP
jgi:hypothetical protein